MATHKHIVGFSWINYKKKIHEQSESLKEKRESLKEPNAFPHSRILDLKTPLIK